ncbi:hypothetical protein [Sporosarcina highlanderae]|uniref:Uncharacterized protein n=1 Tax=Sporosarcina highlanderae TaxID=3035916 RepID=A0ABT8JUI8_9BACL|nr:hypothetical protein [Sporosarcina highlanderae]MDN4608221.1 hypothetical protein [Sporosarcina highlanderae]
MGVIKNCCPDYFFNKISPTTNFPIPPGGVPVDLIQVTVTTEETNDRVRIDSMLSVIIVTGTDGVSGFNVPFRLFRDNTQIATISLTQTGQLKQTGVQSQILDAPNITWTDVPGLPGTYTYRITGERRGGEENILSVSVNNRQIDAIVFPPENC